MCENQELLVGYVYNELDAAERQTFEAHLSSCADCRDELAGLRSTRSVLTSWAPPEPDFGFRIIRGASAPPSAPKRWFQAAWGLAAAAVLVLAAAAAIANVEVRYDQDGFVVRTGWNRNTVATAAVPALTPSPALLTPTTWKADLAIFDRRLTELETARGQGPFLQAASGPRMSDGEVRRIVREIVSQSETRQQQDFALQLTALAREVDRQRRADLVTMMDGLKGAAGVSAARDSQMMNTIVRYVSQQTQQK
jgi:hypothetical protein